MPPPPPDDDDALLSDPWSALQVAKTAHTLTYMRDVQAAGLSVDTSATPTTTTTTTTTTTKTSSATPHSPLLTRHQQRHGLFSPPSRGVAQLVRRFERLRHDAGDPKDRVLAEAQRLMGQLAVQATAPACPEERGDGVVLEQARRLIGDGGRAGSSDARNVAGGRVSHAFGGAFRTSPRKTPRRRQRERASARESAHSHDHPIHLSPAAAAAGGVDVAGVAARFEVVGEGVAGATCAASTPPAPSEEQEEEEQQQQQQQQFISNTPDINPDKHTHDEPRPMSFLDKLQRFSNRATRAPLHNAPVSVTAVSTNNKRALSSTPTKRPTTFADRNDASNNNNNNNNNNIARRSVVGRARTARDRLARSADRSVFDAFRASSSGGGGSRGDSSASSSGAVVLMTGTATKRHGSLVGTKPMQNTNLHSPTSPQRSVLPLATANRTTTNANVLERTPKRDRASSVLGASAAAAAAAAASVVTASAPSTPRRAGTMTNRRSASALAQLRNNNNNNNNNTVRGRNAIVNGSATTTTTAAAAAAARRRGSALKPGTEANNNNNNNNNNEDNAQAADTRSRLELLQQVNDVATAHLPRVARLSTAGSGANTPRASSRRGSALGKGAVPRGQTMIASSPWARSSARNTPASSPRTRSFAKNAAIRATASANTSPSSASNVRLRRAMTVSNRRATASAAESASATAKRELVTTPKSGITTARAVNRRATTSAAGTPSKVLRSGRAPVTIPEPFALTGEMLHQKCQKQLEETRRKNAAIESRRRAYKPRPMPDFSRPFPRPSI